MIRCDNCSADITAIVAASEHYTDNEVLGGSAEASGVGDGPGFYLCPDCGTRSSRGAETRSPSERHAHYTATRGIASQLAAAVLEDQVLAVLRDRPGATRLQLAQHLGLSETTVHYTLVRLYRRAAVVGWREQQHAMARFAIATPESRRQLGGATPW